MKVIYLLCKTVVIVVVNWIYTKCIPTNVTGYIGYPNLKIVCKTISIRVVILKNI